MSKLNCQIVFCFFVSFSVPCNCSFAIAPGGECRSATAALLTLQGYAMLSTCSHDVHPWCIYFISQWWEQDRICRISYGMQNCAHFWKRCNHQCLVPEPQFWSSVNIFDGLIPFAGRSTFTKSLAIAKRPCDCCIILKSGSYTKAI